MQACLHAALLQMVVLCSVAEQRCCLERKLVDPTNVSFESTMTSLIIADAVLSQCPAFFVLHRRRQQCWVTCSWCMAAAGSV
jgi:hypothetical protein